MIFSYPFSEHILLTATSILVLTLPGLVWILCFKNDGRDVAELLGDVIGLSISSMAILGMLFFFLGWRFSGGLIVVLLVVLVIMALYLLIKYRANIQLIHLWWLLGTGLVLVLVITFRFYQAKDLIFPAWVDSVHHVLITQKIIDYGGLPRTLAPELDVPLFYHYGFHLIAALFSLISQLEPVQAVLWFGQVINGLVVLGIYRLSKALWRKTIPAVLAALLVGFAFQMPAYYVTWGRYTLLTGLLVMLPAMGVAYELLMNGFSKERVARLLVLTAGLALVHYLALFYFGLFLLSLVVERFVAWYRSRDPQEQDRKLIFKRVMPMMLSVLGGILVALPWLLRMLIAQSSQVGVQVVLPNAENLNAYQYILYLLGPTHNYFLMGAALLCLILVWWQQKSRGMAFWASMMVLMSLPWGLRFGPFRPDHMAIVLFIPAAIVLSYGWVWLCGELQRRIHLFLGFAVLVVGVFGMLGWGIWQTRNVINVVTILADQSDWIAINWIEDNLPTDARFLTNTTIWQYQTYRGVDGGYWILPKTGRFALALPGLYGYGTTEEKAQWVDWMERASVVHACDDGFWSLVKDARLSHVYLHEGKGSLQPNAMVACPNVEVVFQQNGIWIYEILATE
ncbi:MAG: hypothetical protein K0B14_06130 [Anaerolineaceae bacterium]|nr:hypothetical protein [Anaerolineaceae bacterium]